jgi:hypothetical protein
VRDGGAREFEFGMLPSLMKINALKEKELEAI